MIVIYLIKWENEMFIWWGYLIRNIGYNLWIYWSIVIDTYK
jgi:hypothetical protein